MASASELNFLYSLLPLVSVVIVIAIGVILLNQNFRKNLYQQKLQQEEIKTNHQHELLRSTIDVQEAERLRIANDLHDELGAMLSMARMQVLLIQKQHQGNSANAETLRELIETSLAATRRICYELMPPVLERFGLIASLQHLREKGISWEGITTNFTYSPDFPRLPKQIELAVYRIIYELINNTIKHSGASIVDITLTQNANELSCSYSDNGTGLGDTNHGTGLGLRSMEARAGALGGSFVISNGPGGFHATVTIPL